MDVYVCFAAGDEGYARPVIAALEAGGYSCASSFFEGREERAGEMLKNIATSAVFVLITTARVNDSDYVVNEVSLAFDRKKPIIAMRVEDVLFGDNLLYFMNRKHRVEAFDDLGKGMRELLEAVGRYVRPAGEVRETEENYKTTSVREIGRIVRETEDVGKKASRFSELMTSPAIPEYNPMEFEVGEFTCSIRKYRNTSRGGLVRIPSGFLSVRARAFENCECVTQFELPLSLRKIGRRAFAGCKSLTSVSIPAGVRKIGAGAFEGCIQLKEAVLPSRFAPKLRKIFGSRFQSVRFEFSDRAKD